MIELRILDIYIYIFEFRMTKIELMNEDSECGDRIGYRNDSNDKGYRK